MTQDAARHPVAEHKELDDFVEQLDEYDMSGPQWIQPARELRERLLHHLAEKDTLASDDEADMQRGRDQA